MATKRSIAFLCHPYHRGGVTRWMADAAIAYAGKGYTVYFATVDPSVEFYSGKGRDTMRQLIERESKDVLIKATDVGHAFEFGLPEYKTFVYQQVLTENVPKGTPLIISDDSSVWAAAAGLNDMYPVIAVLHSDAEPYYRLTGQYNTNIDVIACVSQRVVKGVSNKYPSIEPSKIINIPCGINLPVINTNEFRSESLQLIYVGRIIEHPKRMGDLVAIAKSLHQKGIDLRFNIIGDGDATYKAGIEQQFIDAGLKDAVFFRGWLSQAEILPYLEQSDILLLTSVFEGMPISMMEALASGCGFVGTRVSGIEDYENHQLAKDCFGVFEVGNIEDAVLKIQQIASVTINTRRKAARQLAETEFSMDTCLAKYDAVIAAVRKRDYVDKKVSISLIAVLKSKMIAMLRTLKIKRASSTTIILL